MEEIKLPFDPSKISFAIIHHRGEQNDAITADGKRVFRREWVIFDDKMVMCAPYDNHFLYRDPMFDQIIGRWEFMCTCGSPGVVVGYNAYSRYGSPTTISQSSQPGELMVCYMHVLTGKHADGSQ